jgi:glutamate synthase (NADPH/NADH) large chain
MAHYDPTRAYRPRRPPATVEDRDACALYARVAKDAQPTHEAIETALVALEKMLHRAGNLDGEGDGCGLLIDIPREIWAEAVRAGGHAADLVLDPRFAVAHVFIPRGGDQAGGDPAAVQEGARRLMSRLGLRVLAERENVVDSTALGPRAREDEPIFWQVGGLIEERRACFELTVRLEQALDLHVASCSTETAVYKVLGGPTTLGRYHPDLQDGRAKTAAVLGHNRYSTNTWPSFRRVQPFGVLGHNGEINTIARLRQESRMLGVPLTKDGSDSQDLSRIVEALIEREGLTLPEALELALPPIVGEIKGMPEELRGFYMYLRQAFGPFAQGPVALVSRHGDECVFSVDALGLRPLWSLETADAFVFSSEPGVVPLADTVAQPKPLAPGEKLMVTLDRAGGESRLTNHSAMQRLCLTRWRERTGRDADAFADAIPTGGPLEGTEIPGYSSAGPSEPVKVEDRVLGGFGWQREDMKLVQQMAATGAEPIGSLGYDGPLACLSRERQNLADYFKESVAVVTNPAIDREREVEHFSCRAVFGPRPGLNDPPAEIRTLETAFPVILGGHDGLAPLGDSVYRSIAREHKTFLLEDLWEEFRGRAKVLDLSCLESEDTRDAVERLKHEAVRGVRGGAELLVLSDRIAYEGDRRYLDPHLALAAMDLALREHSTTAGETNLRRRCGIVLRSAAMRNVHDMMLALGLGADGVCPYAMVEVGLMDDYRSDVTGLAAALRKGVEKVISTIGIHEVRGYARLFASIGLKPELTAIFDTPAWFGSDRAGLGFSELDADGAGRRRILAGAQESKPGKTFRFYPKVYKAAVAAANGAGSYEDYSRKVRELELEHPVSLRHILDLRSDRPPLPDASAEVGLHSYPIVISSMRFGSQGEVAYRTYAEAAKRINVVAMNGEGGEIQDMYGRYRLWRGQQVASGRFGVTSEMINSSYLVEIKIGQGAKPGEGGHLPARKVTERVAAARNATAGTDLISPSNNHDLYSIEDLAELIDELKTANPDVRVSVKVPVVPNIGTIGVGIAKAGADIITLSGFEGGTGAARSHALRHVGLPSDIGTRAVHLALMEAGIRSRVEIWADGGYRHGRDIVKLHCLGANRVGFGTLAMVSLGCTICRGCQLDTCHVGIATQIESEEEAQLKGLKKFTPQVYEQAVESCARFFRAMGEEVCEITAALGFERAQDLVGRSDLLVQPRQRSAVDLHELIRPLDEMLDLEPLDLPVPEDEREAAGLIAARPIRMRVKEASARIAALAGDVVPGRKLVRAWDEPADAGDRVLGTELAGAISRRRIHDWPQAAGSAGSARMDSGPPPGIGTMASLSFNAGSVGGQGLAAFNVYGIDITVEGGAQDGVAKTMYGGKVAVMKGLDRSGRRSGGSVGKSFAYGAQRGRLFVQGDADSRFCIRFSGADVVIGGEPREPLDDSLGCLADRANIKGFAFEYMTAGRAVVLGDPGPWLCAGQTGGRVYLRVNPDWNLDRAALERRRGKGAKVAIEELDAQGEADVGELLEAYADELRATGQDDEAEYVLGLAAAASEHFLVSVPEGEQTDPSISTE